MILPAMGPAFDGGFEARACCCGNGADGGVVKVCELVVNDILDEIKGNGAGGDEVSTLVVELAVLVVVPIKLSEEAPSI